MIPYVMLNAFKDVEIKILHFCMLEIKTSFLLLFSQFCSIRTCRCYWPPLYLKQFGHNNFIETFILFHEQSGESEF